MAGSEAIFRQLQANIVSVTTNLFAAPPDIATPKHLHPHRWHISYALRGKGTVIVENTRYRLHPGAIILIYPNELHLYAADHLDPYTIYFINIECSGNVPRVFPRYLKASKLTKAGVAVFGKLNYLSHRSSAPSRVPRIMGLLWLLLAELYDLAYRVNDSRAAPARLPNKNHPEFSAILNRLRRAPFRFPGVNNLAASMHMSRRAFTRFFRNTTGMSVREYYLAYVITCARRLMTPKKLTLKEIADRCGYTNAQNFLRAYKCYLTEGRW